MSPQISDDDQLFGPLPSGGNHPSKLMRRYLKNLQNNSVQISFGELFDNQSRFKLLAKKAEFDMINESNE